MFFSMHVWADEAASSIGSFQSFSIINLLNMVMGLVIVIALILGLAWVLKKYGRLPNQNLVDMKVLGGLSLGTREKAILIEVDNTRLLIGVSPGHIQTLHVLGEAAQQNENSFASTMNSVEMQNKQRNDTDDERGNS